MLDDLIEERRKKLKKLADAGVDPYPAVAKRTMGMREAQEGFAKFARAKKKISLAGRIMSLRDQGNLIFLDVKDEHGGMQAVLKKDNLPNFKLLKDTLDRGDFLSVTGTLFKTKKGEKSIEAKSAIVLSKSIRPLPTEWYGVEDPEARFRERYVDLALHADLRELFRKKSIFWQSTREFLLASDFLEVETPILEPIPGGAEAEPFVTHHNALDTDFYLRISPELNLKRLLVGGFEKVFEIGREFRNEGIDAEHLQDFTAMEMYWAYQDYGGLMRFLEKLTKYVIKKTFGSFRIASKGHSVDWGKKWAVYDYYDLFKRHAGLDLRTATKEELLKKASALHITHADANMGRGRLIDLVYKKTVRPLLIKPGFLINPPVDIEPLAKRSPLDRNRVERFQIVAYGTELGKGFSELNDPVDQRDRFMGQAALREAGDREAQMFDKDYVNALEYGMPPAAGFAYSERMFSVLVDKPIREMVFFPLMRPKE